MACSDFGATNERSRSTGLGTIDQVEWSFSGNPNPGQGEESVLQKEECVSRHLFGETNNYIYYCRYLNWVKIKTQSNLKAMEFLNKEF